MPYTSEIEKLERRWLENPKGRNFAPLADAYRKAGELDRAIDLCKSGLERHPDYVSAHIVYGRCLIDKKDDPGAEEVFRKILALDQENILALKVLAEIADRNKRFEQEVEWLTRLLAADPMNGDAAEALSKARTKAATAKTVVPGASPPLGMQPTAVAEAATATMGKPDFVVEQASPPNATVPTTAAPSKEVEAFDGTIDINAAAHQAARAEGIEVQEDVELRPDAVPLEGLARTQYEGSGMFKVDRQDDATTPPPLDLPDIMEDLPKVDLPLIMPEDVAPRAAPPPPPPPPPRPPSPPPPAPPKPPAAAQVAKPRRATPVPPPLAPVPAAVAGSDDDGAADTAALAKLEPVVTETMAELYLKQGHREDALRVFEALLARRPGDTRLRAKVNELSRRKEKSGQSVGAFLRSVLTVRGTLDSAFAGTERAVEESSPGAPTRPARDSISLDSVFGDSDGGVGGGEGVGERSSLAQVEPAAAAAPPPAASVSASPRPPVAEGGGGTGGFSFDEFFSAPTTSAPGPPPADSPEGQKDKAPPSSPRSSRVSGGQGRPPENEGELDHFQAWLKGLKS